MVGDSEQYASAMALMARDLGLPLPCGPGPCPKNEDGGNPDAPHGEDLRQWHQNRIHRQRCHPLWKSNCRAWDGVAFPSDARGETKMPDENQNLTPPNPVDAGPATTSAVDRSAARSDASQGPKLIGRRADADDSPTNPCSWAVLANRTQVPCTAKPLWTLLIACGLIPMFKAILLARARRHGSPKPVAAGWNAIRMLAEQSGITAKGHSSRSGRCHRPSTRHR